MYLFHLCIFPWVWYNNFCSWCSFWTRTIRFYLLDQIPRRLINDSTEHNVLVIKPIRYDCGDEELGTVRVFSCVGHWQQTWNRTICIVCVFPSLSKSIWWSHESSLTRGPMLDVKIFVVKSLAVYWIAACAVTISKIASLNHETRDDTMKPATAVSKTLFICREALLFVWCYMAGDIEHCTKWFMKWTKSMFLKQCKSWWQVTADVAYVYRVGGSFLWS